MSHRWLLRLLSPFVLLSAAICQLGCTTQQRNFSESVVVTIPPSMAEDEATIVLELRNEREQFTLRDSEAFLKSERAAKLSAAVRSKAWQHCEALQRTASQARQELSDGLAIVRPDPQRPFTDGNLVVYLAGKPEIHVFFSCAEIGQVLAIKEMADDLTTIRYSHPSYDSAHLSALRDRVSALGLKVENTSFSDAELEQLKMEAATRILERCLRESGVALPGDAPLLTTGLLASPRSPKLTLALKKPEVLEQLLRSNNPDALRALVYLVNRRVIELAYP